MNLEKSLKKACIIDKKHPNTYLHYLEIMSSTRLPLFIYDSVAGELGYSLVGFIKLGIEPEKSLDVPEGSMFKMNGLDGGKDLYFKYTLGEYYMNDRGQWFYCKPTDEEIKRMLEIKQDNQ